MEQIHPDDQILQDMVNTIVMKLEIINSIENSKWKTKNQKLQNIIDTKNINKLTEVLKLKNVKSIDDITIENWFNQTEIFNTTSVYDLETKKHTTFKFNLMEKEPSINIDTYYNCVCGNWGQSCFTKCFINDIGNKLNLAIKKKYQLD